jgi:hypothetical protein
MDYGRDQVWTTDNGATWQSIDNAVTAEVRVPA